MDQYDYSNSETLLENAEDAIMAVEDAAAEVASDLYDTVVEPINSDVAYDSSETLVEAVEEVDNIGQVPVVEIEEKTYLIENDPQVDAALNMSQGYSEIIIVVLLIIAIIAGAAFFFIRRNKQAVPQSDPEEDTAAVVEEGVVVEASAEEKEALTNNVDMNEKYDTAVVVGDDQ